MPRTPFPRRTVLLLLTLLSAQQAAAQRDSTSDYCGSLNFGLGKANPEDVGLTAAFSVIHNNRLVARARALYVSGILAYGWREYSVLGGVTRVTQKGNASTSLAVGPGIVKRDRT